jgi:pyruvate dehydrogenase E1 component beta subunit
MSWNFSFVAADQLINNAPKIHFMSGGRFDVPIVFRGCNGSAAQVSCQHSHCVESIYGSLPGWAIISPSNAYDAKGLLKSAIRFNNPVLFLENELDYSNKMDIPTDEYTVEIGKAKVLQEGKDATLISYSRMIGFCLIAAKELAKKGFEIEIIDLRTIKPLDIATVAASVRKTHRCVLVEEGHLFGGVSAELGFQIMEHCFDSLDAPIERVCQRETPMPYSKALESQTIPNPERIIAALEKVLL